MAAPGNRVTQPFIGSALSGITALSSFGKPRAPRRDCPPHLFPLLADLTHEGASHSLPKRRSRMIHLTRLNGNPLFVNSELIKYAESSPDTMLTLTNGEKIVVLESCEDVVNRTIAYRGRIFAEAAGHLQALAWTPLPGPPAASDLPQAPPLEGASDRS